MTPRIQKIIEGVIRAEGGFVNDPRDSGGATRYGITERKAREHGYQGDMRALPRSEAQRIYEADYVAAPGFAPLVDICPEVAEEVIDTGVNMGPGTATRFLQRALNVLNDEGRLYDDLRVDGDCGQLTAEALGVLVDEGGSSVVRVLLLILNALQGARYVELAERRAKDRAFVRGWFLGRVAL